MPTSSRRRSARESTRESSERSEELRLSQAQKTAERRAKQYQRRHPEVGQNQATTSTFGTSTSRISQREPVVDRSAENRQSLSQIPENFQSLNTVLPRQRRNSGQSSDSEVDLGDFFNLQVALNSSSMTNPNPLAKLPLKGSGKGPKFPEYVTGQGVKDFIDEVEELVKDVPDINDDENKKEALLRYLNSEVRRTWKAIDGYDSTTKYENTEIIFCQVMIIQSLSLSRSLMSF